MIYSKHDYPLLLCNNALSSVNSMIGVLRNVRQDVSSATCEKSSVGACMFLYIYIIYSYIGDI